MKPKTQALAERLKPVVLYREDLEKIVSILRETSNEISISTDDYTYDDLKELSEIKKEWLTNLKIESRNPFISVNLKQDEVWLFALEDTALYRGVFEKIKQLLSSRKNPFSILMTVWIPSMLLGPLIQPTVTAAAQKNWSTFAIAFSAMLLCVGGTLWGFKARFHRYSVIIPKYRAEAPNFWARNSDKIILAGISAIVGGLLTLLFKKIFSSEP